MGEVLAGALLAQKLEGQLPKHEIVYLSSIRVEVLRPKISRLTTLMLNGCRLWPKQAAAVISAVLKPKNFAAQGCAV